MSDTNFAPETNGALQGGEPITVDQYQQGSQPSVEDVSQQPIPATDIPDAPPTKEVVASGVSEDFGGLRLVLDKTTGRKRLEIVDELPQEEQGEFAESTIAEQATPLAEQTTTQVVEQAVRPYTESELSLAIALNNVDETRIPPKYAIQYATQKVKSELASKQANQATQPSQGTPQTASIEQERKAFYNMVDKLATDNALKEAGFESLDDVALAEYSDDDTVIANLKTFKTAMEYHRTSIMAEVQQRSWDEAQQRRQQEIDQASLKNDIKTFVEQEQAKEPNFAAIEKMMDDYYLNMPYQKAQAFAEAINAARSGNVTRQQATALEEYYKETRIAFYAKQNNLKPIPKPTNKPLVVEKSGTGVDLPKKQANPQDLRSMNWSEKVDWFAKNIQI